MRRRSARPASSTYSSAVFNFIPRTALKFHAAINARDDATVDALMRDFFVPYVRLRARQPGYAVSIVKAGADDRRARRRQGAPAAFRLHGGGNPRTSQALIEKLGPQD